MQQTIQIAVRCHCWRFVLLLVSLSSVAGIILSSSPRVRTYYIAAELQDWQYVPENANMCAVDQTDQQNAFPVPSKPFLKAVYRGYTNDQFLIPQRRADAETHLGILGPIIRAEVGDVIRVVFKNKLPFAANIEPSGVSYDHPAPVAPGAVATYSWTASEISGPNSAAAEKSSKMWVYGSTVDVAAHVHAGLWGPLIVTAKGLARTDATPYGVDTEFVVAMQNFNELATPAVLQDMNKDAIASRIDSGAPPVFNTINGDTFCNLKGLVSNVGERVRWYSAAMGGEEDMHNMHWHGITLDLLGHRLDGLKLLPGATYTLDSRMDNPGTWLLHCHVNDHFSRGMEALFTVNGYQVPFIMTGVVRRYYVSAEMVPWQFAPLGGDFCTGQLQDFTEEGKVFVEPGPERIGSEYLKALYIEYTDATFSKRKERPACLQHMGFLGPVFRAEVGDIIKVLFRNNIPDTHVSLHPHGVLYDKLSEGAPYNDGTTMHADDAVAYGDTHEYVWRVPDRAGPAENDKSTVFWMYHSHTDELADTEAGLVGPMIIGRPASLLSIGLPKDVDQEFFLHFSVMNEGESLLLSKNIAKYLPGVSNPARLMADEEFQESNRMHSINGYMFCNMPGLTFKQGTTARFHIMGLGDVVDLHTPFSFATRWEQGMLKQEAITIQPGTMETADVRSEAAGLFRINCKVDDHLVAGMIALMNITAAAMPASQQGPRRQVYIAAEQVDWDYAPAGLDVCTGLPFNETRNPCPMATSASLCSRFKKAVYREYTDATFTELVPQPAYQGILGPTLHAEAGDDLAITLLNRLDFPVSIQPAGGLVLKSETDPREGVAPGSTATYLWRIPLDAGPGSENTAGVVAYTYLSTVDEIAHTDAGLVGLLLVTAKFGLTSDGRSVRGADMELPVFLNVFNELLSPFLPDNLIPGEEDIDNPEVAECYAKHAVNGFSYCNQPAPVLHPGSKVLVLMLGLGTEDGLHGVVFSGHTLQVSARSVFASLLLPAVTQVGLLQPQALGEWLYYCADTDHYRDGMVAKLKVGTDTS